MVANKYKGVRAALVRSVEEAKLSRQHNDANILCLGSRITSLDLSKEILSNWLKEPFEGGRHTGRLGLFSNLGEALSPKIKEKALVSHIWATPFDGLAVFVYNIIENGNSFFFPMSFSISHLNFETRGNFLIKTEIAVPPFKILPLSSIR